MVNSQGSHLVSTFFRLPHKIRFLNDVPTENKPYRYSSFAVCPLQRNLIVAIMEDHTIDKPADVVNTLVVIDIEAEDDESRLTTLVKGADFYINPSFSPDGKYLAWHEWYVCFHISNKFIQL
jgi:hypothetical protein